MRCGPMGSPLALPHRPILAVPLCGAALCPTQDMGNAHLNLPFLLHFAQIGCVFSSSRRPVIRSRTPATRPCSEMGYLSPSPAVPKPHPQTLSLQPGAQ